MNNTVVDVQQSGLIHPHLSYVANQQNSTYDKIHFIMAHGIQSGIFTVIFSSLLPNCPDHEHWISALTHSLLAAENWYWL